MKTDYMKYRGKCKEYAEAEVKKDPTLRLVRGYYDCPLNGAQPHWWCERPDGTIFDPTVRQFPTAGVAAEYREFDGTYSCEECGKDTPEDECINMGNYMVCSESCARRLVGL